ncbi:MAG: penicillin-binding protein 1A [Methyloceanibacter sp.]|uniref:penicillin-binding protein 1A n=1 Tax=Methyloceanibacter sp. TaxID=1965321 RepID=UPI003D6D0A54
MFAASMILFIAVAGAAAFVLWKVSQELPDYEVLAKYEPPVMTRIHANDGRLIAEFARQRRIYVPITAIPQRLVEAFISAEDKNFYQHGGLDIQGILRAVTTNLSAMQSGRRMVGASTITQQVAKNFLLTKDQNIERKLKEAILAIRIERAFTKEQILELYLNEIYLGVGAYGVAAAAQTYWDKALNELTLADAAYLATLPKAPSNYDPFKYPERAVARRNWVIDRIVENGFATVEEGEEAKASPLGVQARTYGPKIFASEYFAEEVRREILDRFGEDKLYGGGLSVRTTLDPRLQAIARKALVDGLTAYDRTHGGWRGVEKTIDIAGDWGKALAGVPVWSDIEPWKLGVVLEATKDQAKVGIRPGRDKTGKLVEQREIGVIPLEEVKWTRKGAVNAVLKPGDVIYVAPRRVKQKAEDGTETEKVVEGEWSLQQPPEVSGALVALDPHTGRVLAIAGGFSFAQSQFDRATQALRQPGSSFKPLIYTAALDNGYTPSSIIVDGAICIDQGRGMPKWCPKNYSGGGAGPSTLRRGIEKSRNLMTVRLSRDMGMPTIVEYSRRFGVYDNLMPSLAMSLGSGETTLIRMVTAYSMIANGGKKIESTFIDRIQDRYGRTVWRHDRRDCTECGAREWTGQKGPALVDVREQIIDPISAFQMVGIMEGVVQSGTATRLKALKRPLAGKTGTTNDYKDAWFIGFTPDLAVGAYVGYDQPRSMGRSATGGGLAAPIVSDFLKVALEGVPPVPFRAPPGAMLVRVNHTTGLPARPGEGDVVLEAFKPGQAPAGVAVAVQGEGEGLPGQEFPDYPDAVEDEQPPGFPSASGEDFPPPPGQFPPPQGQFPPPQGQFPPPQGQFPPPPGQIPPSQGAGFPGPPPGNDRALTSGTGGLY